MSITTETQAQTFLQSLSPENRERVGRILELFEALTAEERVKAIAEMERVVNRDPAT